MKCSIATENGQNFCKKDPMWETVMLHLNGSSKLTSSVSLDIHVQNGQANATKDIIIPLPKRFSLSIKTGHPEHPACSGFYGCIKGYNDHGYHSQ